MRNFIARGLVAVLLACLTPCPIFARQPQDGTQQQTKDTEKKAKQPQPTSTKGDTEWDIGESLTIFGQTDPPPASGKEPIIRVALATDVRAATVSTNGHLMNASEDSSQLVALDVTRVRLEPRLLSPLPADADDDPEFRIEVTGLSSREDADAQAKDVREAIEENSQVVFDTDAKTWSLLVGNRRPRIEAEELGLRLERAGIDAKLLPVKSAANRSAPAAKDSNSVAATGTRNVRPAAHYTLPTREVVASAPGTGRLFSSSAPVLLASDSETSPVRFDDRPYRGRIEVFANTHGSLTVVNVLGMEDYVKGVVPNELSAGGYPLLEAHKAQAIAARTYALRNRGQFQSEGYDLLPTTRSQVYRGLVSENSLSSRAVDETRGIIATYDGQPINALYTSTCGGRTEDAENIFNNAVPYLKARECAAEGRAALTSFIVKTNRDPAELKEEQNVPYVRDVALLATQNFSSLRAKVSDSWLKDEVDVAEVRAWLSAVARLAHQVAPTVTEGVNTPGPFASALTLAVFGESRGGTLLSNADVEYFLAVRDANEVPQANRADVAMLLRDGYLSVLPDATLRPQERLSRARALHTIARILEARTLLQLQKGSARPTADDNLVLRSTKGKDLTIKVSDDVFLFRQIGEMLFPVKSVALVGGEPVVFHVNSAGEVDYLEVRPATTGASADRFSPFSNWSADMSLGQAQSRLGRYASGIGSLIDLRVTARGRSRRATDLEIVGTDGTRQVLGGKIRSALGLREQLFVIEKKYDDNGRVTGFTFLGRGWGHGVGMCQVGAYGLARQGFSYDQILKAYYSGIDLTRLY
ncbi:MAG TPA: SpoIID/LytB domain-containing protein [Pyrinomonadaceae bacterium]|nr:SpoIID/LytB domain-containing protein [Pyrinomonadaceae bacterium]